MYKIQVDNVPKNQMAYFKSELLKATGGKGNVYICPEDKAIFEYHDGYFVTEESLVNKSMVKKAVNEFLCQFRRYQFDQI